jgi:hypothetical protein
MKTFLSYVYTNHLLCAKHDTWRDDRYTFQRLEEEERICRLVLTTFSLHLAVCRGFSVARDQYMNF